MQPRISIITLGVQEMGRSIRFYRDGLAFPTQAKDDASWALFSTAGTRFALFPRDLLANDASVTNAERGGSFAGITLAYNAQSKEEVDAVLASARQAGGSILKPAGPGEYIAYGGYFADPDGYAWEVAWDPVWRFAADGQLFGGPLGDPPARREGQIAGTNALFLAATSKLLREITEGPPPDWSYVLNAGDPGLLGTLEKIDAAEASAKPTGPASIANHVDHVCYGLSLLNRWAAGEENPFATADWEAGWRRERVDADQWRELRNHLREQLQNWRAAIERPREFDEVTAAGTLASVAHTAYHLGAIRQMVAAAHRLS